MPKPWVSSKLPNRYNKCKKCYKRKAIVNKKEITTQWTKLLLHTSFYLLKKVTCSRVQILFWVGSTLRKFHGLYTLTTPIKLYRVCKCCMKTCSLKLRCCQCLLWKYCLCKYKWCSCKGQKPTWFLRKCLIGKCKPKITCHQLTKPKKLKGYSG